MLLGSFVTLPHLIALQPAPAVPPNPFHKQRKQQRLAVFISQIPILLAWPGALFDNDNTSTTLYFTIISFSFSLFSYSYYSIF